MSGSNEVLEQAKSGPFLFYVEDGVHSGSGRQDKGVSHYVSVNAPLDTFEQNKDNWYALIRATEEGLQKQGFKTQRSFRHDYMTEEYVIPVEEKMKDGSTFTRDALVSGLQPIAAAFEKEHYPRAAKAAADAGQQAAGGRGGRG